VKKPVLLELTIPWEEGCNKAYERKCGGRGLLLSVKLECRQFPAQFVWTLPTVLGAQAVLRVGSRGSLSLALNRRRSRWAVIHHHC